MKRIEYGIKNVHFALRKKNEEGKIVFEKPTPVPYARSTDMAPQGESTPIYADNIVIYTANANQGYSGSLNFTAIQDFVYEKFLNYMRDSKGNLIEDADKQPVEFALLFEFENDVKATRYAFYNCTLTRPNVSSNTKEQSITVNDKTLTITAISDDQIVEGKNIVLGKTSETTDTTSYSSWYDAVQIPEFVAE